MSFHGVRELLSAQDEQQVLRTLKEQQRRHHRVTSDDVRQAARAVVSKRGSISLPPDFPPTRWVLDFKRVHGFVQFNSFTFGAAAFGLPERLEVARPPTPASAAQVTTSSIGAGSDNARPVQTPLQMQHSLDQRHRRFQEQQQQRMQLVGDRRGTPRSSDEKEDSSASGDSEGTTSIRSSTRPATVSVSESSGMDDIPDNSSTSSACDEKRGYKLSHTVPAETWDKAIAAVEQRGMSLRSAAKMYGVHFAALHRRVKKRAQGGQAKGNNGYFHPSDEAGIMRVVVAHAELGVLMTFEELMSLVEAAALRKLPDISVGSARKLLARFQSRNEQSIRHLIVDWPPPLPALATASPTPSPLPSPSQSVVQTEATAPLPQQTRPASSSPGPVAPQLAIRRSLSGGTGGAATATAVAAASSRSLFVPPSRVGPMPPTFGNPDQWSKPSSMRITTDTSRLPKSSMFPGPSSQRLLVMGSRARSEGDADPVMVV